MRFFYFFLICFLLFYLFLCVNFQIRCLELNIVDTIEWFRSRTNRNRSTLKLNFDPVLK